MNSSSPPPFLALILGKYLIGPRPTRFFPHSWHTLVEFVYTRVIFFPQSANEKKKKRKEKLAVQWHQLRFTQLRERDGGWYTQWKRGWKVWLYVFVNVDVDVCESLRRIFLKILKIVDLNFWGRYRQFLLLILPSFFFWSKSGFDLFYPNYWDRLTKPGLHYLLAFELSMTKKSKNLF